MKAGIFKELFCAGREETFVFVENLLDDLLELRLLQLGKNTYSTGKVSYELIDEMCRVLEEFVKVMDSYHVSDYRAYATTAMRLAKNNQIILEQIRVRTGICVKVLSNSGSICRRPFFAVIS